MNSSEAQGRSLSWGRREAWSAVARENSDADDTRRWTRAEPGRPRPRHSAPSWNIALVAPGSSAWKFWPADFGRILWRTPRAVRARPPIDTLQEPSRYRILPGRPSYAWHRAPPTKANALRRHGKPGAPADGKLRRHRQMYVGTGTARRVLAQGRGCRSEAMWHGRSRTTRPGRPCQRDAFLGHAHAQRAGSTPELGGPLRSLF